MTIRQAAIGAIAGLVAAAGLYIYKRVQQEREVKKGIREAAMYVKNIIAYQQIQAERYYEDHTSKQHETMNLIKE